MRVIIRRNAADNSVHAAFVVSEFDNGQIEVAVILSKVGEHEPHLHTLYPPVLESVPMALFDSYMTATALAVVYGKMWHDDPTSIPQDETIFDVDTQIEFAGDPDQGAAVITSESQEYERVEAAGGE